MIDALKVTREFSEFFDFVLFFWDQYLSAFRLRKLTDVALNDPCVK